MKPCPECECISEVIVSPRRADRMELWEDHLEGCSHSPMCKPTQVVHRWRMREMPRADGVTKD